MPNGSDWHIDTMQIFNQLLNGDPGVGNRISWK